LAAGAAVCANAVPISNRDARAVAVAREEIFVMRHLNLNGTPQPSRGDDEPRVNEAGYPAFS
jgi:hypothetical protein